VVDREISIDFCASLQATQLVDWHCDLQMFCRNFAIFPSYI